MEATHGFMACKYVHMNRSRGGRVPYANEVFMRCIV